MKSCRPYTRLVVFDSKLGNLRLPVEIIPLSEAPEESQATENDPMDDLLTFVEPFFDTLAVVEDGELLFAGLGFTLIRQQDDQEDVIPSSQVEDTAMDDGHITTRISKQMSFFSVETDDSDMEDPFEVVHWQEERVKDVQNGKARTLLYFTNGLPGASAPLVLPSILD